VTFIPVIGEVIATCIFLAPLGSIPPPIGIDADGLAIVIELFSGIGDMEWLFAADGWLEAHAAAASESAVKPTPSLTAEPRERPQDVEVDMSRTSSGARPLTGTITDGYGDVC